MYSKKPSLVIIQDPEQFEREKGDALKKFNAVEKAANLERLATYAREQGIPLHTNSWLGTGENNISYTGFEGNRNWMLDLLERTPLFERSLQTAPDDGLVIVGGAHFWERQRENIHRGIVQKLDDYLTKAVYFDGCIIHPPAIIMLYNRLFDKKLRVMLDPRVTLVCATTPERPRLRDRLYEVTDSWLLEHRFLDRFHHPYSRMQQAADASYVA